VLYELLAGFTPFGGGHPGAVLRRHVTETVAPLPGIPDELWQLLVQCLAKAPASRLRAAELGDRLREVLPDLAGMPPLDVDEPAEGSQEYATAAGGATSTRSAAAKPATASMPATASAASVAMPSEPLRGAVPLVRAAMPDSNRDTHTSMRVPSAEELAGGARGTARVPRLAGQPRPGSARASRGAAMRLRRLKTVAAVIVVAAAGIGGWLAATGDANGTPPGNGSSATSPP
jgi:serine/threonine-protein kinase